MPVAEGGATPGLPSNDSVVSWGERRHRSITEGGKTKIYIHINLICSHLSLFAFFVVEDVHVCARISGFFLLCGEPFGKNPHIIPMNILVQGCKDWQEWTV